MISDEVICGFGRTGEWFGAQALGFEPTSLSMAKQLTARLPAALGGGDRRAEWPRRSRPTPDGSAPSATATPTAATRSACAVGVKALEIYERIDISARVRGLAPRFAAHLDRLAAHPLVGEARHLGLIGALELAPEQLAQGLRAAGQGRRAAGAGADRRAA